MELAAFPRSGSANTVDVTTSDPDASAATTGGLGFAPQGSGLDAVLAKMAFYINGALSGLIDSPASMESFSFNPSVGGTHGDGAGRRWHSCPAGSFPW